jgi:mutator protein MutT
MEIWDIYNNKRQRTGRTAVREAGLNPGEFHIVVFGIVKNGMGQFILSKRSSEKTFAGTWEVTGGSVTTGESSYEAVVREIKEEIGLTLVSEGKQIDSFVVESECSHFVDIWLFEEEFYLEELTCQEGEVSEIQIASKEKIIELFEKGEFMPGAKKVMECIIKIDLD